MGVVRDLYDVRMPTSPGTDRPMFRRRPLAVLAGILLVGNTTLFAAAGNFGVLAVPAAVLASGPVLLAWYRPVAAWVVIAVAGPLITYVGVALASPMTPLPWYFNVLFTQLPVMYVLALSAARRVTAIACVVTIAAGTAAVALFRAADPMAVVTGVGSWSLVLLAAMLVGDARRARRLDTLRAAEEVGRTRILEERTRIARELHDVVAHHMSVIAVQAASAPYRVEGGVSGPAAREFAAINAAARASLRDMRLLLGALRGTDGPARTAPQPGLTDLDELVESVRRAGVPVRLAVAGEPSVSPVESVTVYRIAQEALSNVVRHAPAAETTVVVRADADGVAVEVDNEPPPRTTPAVEARGPGGRTGLGLGLGLIGMRERVAALGGEVTAGATEEGGFTVRARLPKGDDA
ncbi:sensor histidine kinase [Nonomuraea sp. K274]|uniref:histidine kinase n=1 Tax=Nonomuraea cypriaca TaxID=1187855 RepID=A0A931EXW9_9ACTN|nr:histidine kinase [Nonomuraea cypriaca]MBF8186710.1 sensor histidine kinase [Nonomuraea cypriaca]